MSRHKRVTLSTMMVLFLIAGLVVPAVAQTGPYQPEEAPPEEAEVEGVVIEAPEEPQVEDEAPEEELADVRGLTLVRTGSDTLLLLVAGLLVVGLGVLMVLRSRRRGTADG